MVPLASDNNLNPRGARISIYAMQPKKRVEGGGAAPPAVVLLDLGYLKTLGLNLLSVARGLISSLGGKLQWAQVSLDDTMALTYLTWRRTTLDSYRTEAPEWQTVLDLDALSKKEDVTWVWGGCD